MEREFRGFGRVDQTDAERVGATHGKGLFPDYPDPINGETPLPPILTKTWFSTGAWRERAAQLAAYAAEQWTGDSAAPAIPGPLLPTDLPADELPEAHRAHRGQLLRQEIYALDGTPAEAHPYLVTETAVEIRRLQPRHPTSSKRPAHPGVFHLIQRETRSWAYDRDPHRPPPHPDPRPRRRPLRRRHPQRRARLPPSLHLDPPGAKRPPLRDRRDRPPPPRRHRRRPPPRHPPRSQDLPPHRPDPAPARRPPRGAPACGRASSPRPRSPPREPHDRPPEAPPRP
ncbi:MAG: hypothetical protein IPG04_40305 [Polyangiaceae bacterium]|nr:hypothetical protein [Polyangiaceae bacterium]